MALRPLLGEVALPSAARGSGTYVSGPIAAPNFAQDVALLVHCTAASGTGPTLNVSLEESSDGTTWTAITGSGATQLTAAGNESANAAPSKAYIRVTSTVAGTSPSFTYRVTVLVVGG